MRIRTVALALALTFGLTTLAPAAQKPAVRHAKRAKLAKVKKYKVKKSKQSKAFKATKVKPRKFKAPKHKA